MPRTIAFFTLCSLLKLSLKFCEIFFEVQDIAVMRYVEWRHKSPSWEANASNDAGIRRPSCAGTCLS